jgi:dCTP deaminase
VTVLNGQQIRERMGRKAYGQRLLITPLLSEAQIGSSTVDVRLGSTILLLRKARVGSIDITDEFVAKSLDKTTYDVVQIRYFKKFVLHPHSLILASTFEYLSFPYDLTGTIVSRSSWGRLGLVIATASIIHPGFKGCLTLELANLGDSPITLYPGERIGQLEINEVKVGEKEAPVYTGTYQCPTEPEPPKFHTSLSDHFELGFWSRPSGSARPGNPN